MATTPRNPYAPTFGSSPPVFAGREEILAGITEAFDTGPTHPDYTAILIGVRGAGKTVTLNAIEDAARERGWQTVSVDATGGQVIHNIIRRIQRIGSDVPELRLSRVKLLRQELSFDYHGDEKGEPNLRDVLTGIGELADEEGTGLLITVDEIHSIDADEMRAFGSAIQHVTRREEHSVAFVGAGLPSFEETLLADDAITFLQRCARYDLDRLSDEAVREALAKPIEAAGGRIDEAAVPGALQAASGYAFMVQLIGFHMWRNASNPTGQISTDEVRRGIEEAKARIGQILFAPSWKDLSAQDRRFLQAMADDDRPSQMSDVAERLGRAISYASVYRARLIKAGWVVAVAYGVVDFAHHAARSWVRLRSG